MLKNRLLNILIAWVGGLILFVILSLALQVGPVASDSHQITDTATNNAPSLEFTVTVGLDPAVCAPTDTINVIGSTNVIYCFAVRNSGDVTFTRNTLVDGRFGTLLDEIFLPLTPGQSTFFTTAIPVAQTSVSTATWDAYDIDSYTIDDTGPYTFTDISSFGMPINLGPDGAENTASPENFNIQLFSSFNHHFRVDMNGIMRQLPSSGQVPPLNGSLPSNISNQFKNAYVPFWDDLDNASGGVYHTATGTIPNRIYYVQWDDVPHFDGTGDTTFQIILNEGVGDILFSYADVDLGSPTLNGGNSATIGLQKNPSTAVQYSFNTASITNNMTIRFSPTFITATDIHTATVNVIPIATDLELTATVGTIPGVCASTTSTVVPENGGDVYYCYEVMNTGNYPMDLHDLTDNRLGPIFSGLTYTLGVSQSIDTISLGITVSQFVTRNTVNVASWTGYNPGPTDAVTSTAVTTVTLTPAPNIVLTKTAGLDPNGCATSSTVLVPRGGREVYYCYQILNTGNITLSLHDLNDDVLGNIFNSLPYDLAPGESIDTVSEGITVSQFITQDTINTGLWLAYNPGPTNTVTATAVATATIDPTYVIHLPVVQKAESAAALPLWLTPLAAIVPMFGLVVWRRKKV